MNDASEGIIYVEDRTPAVIGTMGRAWKRDTAVVWERLGKNAPSPELTVADWIIEATYAHPLWHSYHLICYSLRAHASVRGETRIYLPGATHELLLYALDPDKRRNLNDVPDWLTPCNFSAQIIAASDDVAADLMLGAVGDVVNGVLNPDTDNIRAWADRFGDNMLKRGVRDLLASTKGTTVIYRTGATFARVLGLPGNSGTKNIH